MESKNLFVFTFVVNQISALNFCTEDNRILIWFWICFQNWYYDKNKQDLKSRNENEQDWKIENGKIYDLKITVNIDYLDTKKWNAIIFCEMEISRLELIKLKYDKIFLHIT